MQATVETKPKRKKDLFQLLPLIPLAVVVGFVAQQYIAQQQRAQVEATRQALTPVALALELPDNASEADIYAKLSTISSEREDARKARIARKVGMDLNWDRIFTRLEHLKGSERNEALRAIEEEYQLPSGLSLQQMKQSVTGPSVRKVKKSLHLLPVAAALS